jgi:DNA modification methylase
MGRGEMSAAEFEAFLRTTLGHAARHSDDGSIHFVCMHWGKIRELLAAAAVLNGTSKSELSLHPTVKPVALVADAIRDCSNRKGAILDPFGGAGTTLIAAEQTGRRACLIEIDPRHVDVAIKRWQNLPHRTAVCAVGAPYPDTGPRPGDGPPTNWC